MVVHTESEKVVAARKFVLEMLFSERIHYCMYCPVSEGEGKTDCELQAAAYRYGLDSWQYAPNYAKSGPWMPRASTSSWTTAAASSAAAASAPVTRSWPTTPWACAIAAPAPWSSPTAACRSAPPPACPAAPACRSAPRARSSTGAAPSRGTAPMWRGPRPPAWPAPWAAASRPSPGTTACCGWKSDWDSANGGLLCVHGRFEVVEPQPKRITAPLVRKGRQAGGGHLGRGPGRGQAEG